VSKAIEQESCYTVKNLPRRPSESCRLIKELYQTQSNSKCSFVTYNYKRLISKSLKTIHQMFWKDMPSISNFVLYLKDEMKY